MKLERSIHVDIDEALARERAVTYFALAGYSRSICDPHLMSFQRGSFPPWTPKKWNVNAVIQTNPDSMRATRVSLILDVDTSGQMVIESERRFWRNELDDLEQFIRTGKTDADARARENRSLLRRSAIASALVIGLIVLLVIGVFVAVFLLAG